VCPPPISTSPPRNDITQLHTLLIMANAESPDPSKDLLPVDRTDEEVDPLAPAPEPKLPTRKDASLKEFLAKMDDYAPIVSELNSCMTPVLMGAIDSRCCDQLLSYKSRSSSTAPNRPTSRSSSCACYTKVHCRYCCGRLSIFSDPILKFFECKQSDG